MQNNQTISTDPVEAQKANGSNDFEELIYLLSHDMRNSLRALVEVPQWIREDLEAEGIAMSSVVSENFDLMDTQTRRMEQMMEDLLVYSRVGRKQNVGDLDLQSALAAVLGKITVPDGFRIFDDLDFKTLRFGERDIETLLEALISNAIKHHDKDAGTITISSAGTAGEWTLSISDDGPGIEQRHRDRVFLPMTTLKPRDEVEGSGMGLATVRKIVELYGGNLGWNTADTTTGARLDIRFPIANIHVAA